MAIRVLLVLSLTLVDYCFASAEEKIDLSSPDATILTYCNAVMKADLSAVRQSFHQSARLEEESFKKPLWTECKIVEKHKTKLVGKDLGNGLQARGDDVEVVTEVRMIDPRKGNPKMKFWHLLRNINGNWKIISHSHLPDKNYPRID